MAINGNLITSKAVEDNNTIVLEMLSTRPAINSAFAPARKPGQLCGYYDATTQKVELYMVNASGIRFVKVG